MGIKHRADSGFRKFSALIYVRFGRTVKSCEMPYVSYPRLDAIKMNSMKTVPTQVFLVNVLLWSVFFFFINEILVFHSSLADLKEKIADGFTIKILAYILGGLIMTFISRYIKRRENTSKINQ